MRNKKEFFEGLYNLIIHDTRFIHRKERKEDFIELMIQIIKMLYLPTKDYTGHGVYKPFIEHFGVYLSDDTLDEIVRMSGLSQNYISCASMGFDFEIFVLKLDSFPMKFSIQKEDFK